MVFNRGLCLGLKISSRCDAWGSVGGSTVHSCHFDAPEYPAHSAGHGGHRSIDSSCSSRCCHFVCLRDTPATWNLDVSYVDDIALAIPVHADQVIKTLRSTISCASLWVSAISTTPQLLCWKTEALVDAFGPGARAFRMALCNTHACSVNCADEHGSTTIRICRAYKHLGSIVSVQANISSQSCYGRHSCPCSLCSKHRATNQECGALFLCFEQVFLPHSNLAEAQFYTNLARVASGCPSPDGIPAKSTAQMLSKVSQLPLQIAMAAARLLFLTRLLKVATTALLILLDANRSWCDVLRHGCLSHVAANQVLPQPDGPRLPVLV